MGQAKGLIGILLAVAVVIASFSIFTVNEREKVILFRLGEIVSTDYGPGLHWKTPFVNNVRKFDARIQTLDAEPERYLTGEKKNLIVDSFVKWRINDVSNYFTATGGDAVRANLRLSQIVKDGLRGEFAKRTIKEAVSGERLQIMELITKQANKQAEAFGIEIIDVRIKRIDFPPEISDSVYRRMRAEREGVAKDLRSRGAESAEIIRAEADRQRTVIIADAFRDAEIIRGEGDAGATEIYAKAYGKDVEFYSLYRSLNAYKTTFASKSDILVIEPDSEFFKYFK
ncbi:MAG: protease modulator HflC [Gammaproteobacteria bacterium]|nr:protease modulator HflC [Gammaproteobacteria bacterium]MCF6260348.1 protease modulator HflC [Gammaproteobacteria bacterium]